MEKPSSFLFIGLRMVSVARKQNREARKRDPSGPEGVAMVLGKEKATALEAQDLRGGDCPSQAFLLFGVLVVPSICVQERWLRNGLSK